jgi:hypothetical protein
MFEVHHLLVFPATLSLKASTTWLPVEDADQRAMLKEGLLWLLGDEGD